MKLCGSLGIILALACLQSVMAQSPDTIWTCREDTGETYYRHMYLSDTFPDNRDSFAMVDTGDVLEGKYVNFDYKFTAADSGLYYDTVTDALGNPLIVSGYRYHPGYAGFKMFWDYGVTSFWVEVYDSLIFWHKGPLPGHKVMMIWAQGSAGCGTPINYEKFGEFYSSSVWKRESFSFPQKRHYGAAPDSQFVKTGLFELRMLICNDSAVSTSPTSAMGDLKFDNMYFYRPPAHIPVIWEQPGSLTAVVGCQAIIRILALGGSGNSGLMTYAWTKDGNPITETTARLVIDPAQLSDAGTYTVVVTNSLGSDTSDAATLTVEPAVAPAITTDPQSQSVNDGDQVTFSAAASGTPSPKIQWQRRNSGDTNWNDLYGNTNNTLTFKAVSADNKAMFHVVATNICSGETCASAAATLTINPKEKKDCGCGSGTGLALIPPLFFKAMAHRKRKKKNPKT